MVACPAVAFVCSRVILNCIFFGGSSCMCVRTLALLSSAACHAYAAAVALRPQSFVLQS